MTGCERRESELESEPLAASTDERDGDGGRAAASPGARVAGCVRTTGRLVSFMAACVALLLALMCGERGGTGDVGTVLVAAWWAWREGVLWPLWVYE